nr:amidohydrolase [Photobacterium leiognathi]
MMLKKTLLAASLATLSLASSSAFAIENVDILIKNGQILTMDSDRTIFDRGLVAIKDNKIVAVTDGSNIGEYKPAKTIDVDGDIVMPGLINTHTHASMTVFRSLADDVPDRLHRYIFPLEKKLVSREMVRIGAQLGNVEMVKGGVTTYADMYYFEDEVAKTVDQIGMRAILGETIIKFPVASAKTPEDGIKYAEKLIKEYKDHPRITMAFAPHGPYTNSTETLQKIAELSVKYDAPVMMHLAESDRERDVIAKRSGGLSPVKYMESIGALNDNFIAAHVIDANDEDIAILKKYDVGVAHNMSANIKSAKGVAPALKMFNEDLRIGLGTDGPMSGNTLSTIDELNQVAKVHKLVNKDRAAMPPKNVIEMATIGAARALHMEDKLGSLEVGKLADVIVIDTKAPNMVPVYNPYSALVYSAYATNVKHTIVDGKLIMEDRNLLTVNEDNIRKEAQTFADKVRKTVIESGEIVQ